MRVKMFDSVCMLIIRSGGSTENKTIAVTIRRQKKRKVSTHLHN